MNKNTTKQNKSQALLFSFNQSVTADFKGGKISSDGGLVLLREFDKRTSFIQGFNNCVFDPRNPFLILHEQEELLRQRVFQIVTGYEDADDADLLRHDPLFQLSVKNKKNRGQFTVDELASQPTISRLENRITLQEIEKINDFMLQNYMKSTAAKEKKPKMIILDTDSTDDPTHGNQQMSMFNGYYEETAYHPLLITEPESKLFLGAYLRPGNVHTADKVLDHISPIVQKLKNNFSETTLIFRADSGYSSPAIHEYCRKEGLSFVVGVPTNKVLAKKVAPYIEKAKTIFEAGNKEQPIKIYASLRYKAASWSRQQKIVVKIEINKHEGDVRFVATDLKGKAKDIYGFYTQRGDSENRIEELKNGFHADRLSCHAFYANYFRLLLHTCAYNFILLLRGNLNNTELADAKIDTFRLRVLKVGAWIKTTVRKIWIHFSSAWPFRNLFQEVYTAIANSPHYSLA